MRGQQVPGTVLHQASTPVIETPSGDVQRNHTHLRIRTNTHGDAGESVVPEQALSAPHRPVTCS